MDNDLKWKFKAIELAANEMLSMKGEYENLDDLFERARQIYCKGYQEDFFKWSSVFNQEKKSDEKSESNTKECPKCGDIVPSTMKVHYYGSNGICGHKF